MRSILIPALLLLTSGCATLSSNSYGDALVGDTAIRLLVAESESHLRALVQDLANPAATTTEATLATAATQLDEARISVAARTLSRFDEPGLAGKAEYLALGLTLKICRDGVQRISTRYADGRASAASYARNEFALTCLAPLSVLAF